LAAYLGVELLIEETADEANRLACTCTGFEEKLIVWTLLDTGLGVAELAGLTKNVDWQGRIMIYGKGGPFGTKSKRRVIPLSARVQSLIEGHFALRDKLEMSVDPACCAGHREPRASQPKGFTARPSSHIQRGGRAEGDIPASVAATAGTRPLGDDRNPPQPLAGARDPGIQREVVIARPRPRLKRSSPRTASDGNGEVPTQR
jgi:hypothetical protein